MFGLVERVMQGGGVYTSAYINTSEPRVYHEPMQVTPFFTKLSVFLFKYKLLASRKAPSSEQGATDKPDTYTKEKENT